MPHKILTIMDAIADQLRLDLDGVEVYRNRSRPADVTPSILIKMGGDQDTEDGPLSTPFRQVAINIELLVSSSVDDDLDLKLLNLRVQVETSLYQSNFTPIGLQYFLPINQSEPDFNSEGDYPVAAMNLELPAIYMN